MQMKRILITGANSYVGTNVDRWLQKEPDKYHVDTIDMIDGSWREKSFAGYDVVFHVAGIAHVKAKKSQEALYYKVNTDLAIETARKAKADGVKQFIFMSSMIVYGESKSLKPVTITKDTQPSPNGFYGNSKLQAEIGIQQLEDEYFKVAILRPPMIYGPGSKGNFPRLVALAKKTPIFPAYHNQRSMLYIDNLCEFLKFIVEEAESGVFFPQDQNYVSTTDVIKIIKNLQGKRVLFIKQLSWIVVISSQIIPSVNKLFGSFTYDLKMTKYKYDYQLINLEEGLKNMGV